MAQNTLDSLQKRRNMVQSLSEHLKHRCQSVQKSNLELYQPNCSHTIFNQDSSSNLSNDIIENSDTEIQPINVTNRQNISINTSSDGDNINTSTISLPRSHTSFFGVMGSNLIPPNSPLKKNTCDENKINIISVEIIKPASNMSMSPTDRHSECNTFKEDSATPPPAEAVPLDPLLRSHKDPLLSNVTTDQPEASCSVSSAESPTLNLNSIPAVFYSAQPKTSCQMINDLNICDVKPSSPSLAEMQPGPSSLCKTSPLARRRKISSKKCYMDFLSDEEEWDFSADSSHDWTCNESESSGSPKNKKKKRIKKKKVQQDSNNKPKKEKPINRRKQRKKLKDEGKAYETEKGNIVKEKSMGINPCDRERCKRGCFDITDERRKSLFDFFWSLDPQRRRDWLVNSCRVISIARKRTDSPVSRRNVTYEYFINNGEDRQKVCQKFLIETLNITQKYLLYNLSHSKEGMSQKDLRTRTIPDKYSEEAKAYARSFIENLPAVPSHYNRKRSNRGYLPQELKNISNLHRIYQQECKDNKKEAVGDSVFRDIFKEYNISFHVPKKDKCLLCIKAERNDIVSEEDKKKLEAHLREKKSTYQRFLTHQKLKGLGTDTLTTSFDLQKVLTTPHGDSMLLGYARKYAVFNFTLYESGTQNVYCYIWGECDGKRGSQEIASCLFKYFQEVDKRNVTHLLLYCDSAVGQNKNKVVLTAINYFLKLSKNVQTIQLNFLLPGHTYMPVDSVHATIEREVQKMTVWSPSQWAPYISSARKRPRPYQVIFMDNSDFMNWEEFASKAFTKETLKNVQFKNIRIVTFKKKCTDQFYFKYSTDENALAEKVTLFEESENGRKLKGKRKGKGGGKGKSRVRDKKDDNKVEGSQTKNYVLKNLYNTRLPISTAKFNDLKRLCESGAIPKPYHNEYLNLPHHKSIKETLIDTDEEDSSSSSVSINASDYKSDEN